MAGGGDGLRTDYIAGMRRGPQSQLSNHIETRPIAAPADVRAFRRRWADLRGAALLESVADDAFFGRYSIYAAEPITTLNSEDLRTLGGYAAWAARLRAALPNGSGNVGELPFVGGWIGALAYEAGQWIEPTVDWRHEHPWMAQGVWRLYDGAVLYDKKEDRWWVTAVEVEGAAGNAATRVDVLAAQVEALGADGKGAAAGSAEPADCGGAPTGDWNYSEADYLAKVVRVIEYLHAGDIYQANLSRRLRMNIDRAVGDVYLDLCRANPAAFAALVRVDDDEGPVHSAILSSSPELLLDTRADGRLMSRPIKGTRPRTGDVSVDEQASLDLDASIKERAELNMIIDLVRNDLGRVAQYGSVVVREAGRIEYHPTVIHRTATVEARLRDGLDGFDALAGMFPGGSVTGAPKVRAMQIIHELEPDSRGAYCGAIGFVNVDGAMRFNLPIRTMMMHEGRVELSVGSGIVADSTPEGELEELYAKARGMLRALGIGETVRVEA